MKSLIVYFVFSVALLLFFNQGYTINNDYNVGVYYYPWYTNNDFHGGGFMRDDLIPQELPYLGEYNQQSASVINQHISWSTYAGINFWVISWWGPGSNEDTTILDCILPNPNIGNIKVALFYESAGRTANFTTYSNLSSDMAYIADNYFGNPNYYTIQGKPVFFIYLTRVFSQYSTLSSSLSTFRNAAAAKGYSLYIVGDQAFGYPNGGNPACDTSQVMLMDAITNYDVYGSMGATLYAGQSSVNSYFSQQSAWQVLAHSVGTDFIPGVSPGFNDTGVRTGHTPLSRQLTFGADFSTLFDTELQQAKTYTDTTIGKMIIVTSFNEWHEDSQIEPTISGTTTTLDNSSTGNLYTFGMPYEGYGTRYLDVLRTDTYPSDLPLWEYYK